MRARRIASIVLGTVLLIAPASFARQFALWESRQDLFGANFPGTPTVTTITWETEYGARLPARVYTATLPGPRTYSVTAIDYSPVQKLLTAQAKTCDQTDERCTGNTSFPGAGYWKNDVRGAMVYVAARVMKRDVRIGHYAWSFLGAQAVENHELQMVNNKDGSRTFVNIMMHHNMLYIMEETTPANFPPPGLFVQSMALKEADGSPARHYGVYFNGPTIDPVEAKSCSTYGFTNRGGGPGNGANANPCDSLPADLRFHQGPTPVPVGAPPIPPGTPEPRGAGANR